VTTGQLKTFKKHLEADQTGAARTMLQNRRTFGVEKNADSLEEIPYIADRELTMANTEMQRNRSGKEGT
jgi:hypothetical protein